MATVERPDKVRDLRVQNCKYYCLASAAAQKKPSVCPLSSSSSTIPQPSSVYIVFSLTQAHTVMVSMAGNFLHALALSRNGLGRRPFSGIVCIAHYLIYSQSMRNICPPRLQNKNVVNTDAGKSDGGVFIQTRPGLLGYKKPGHIGFRDFLYHRRRQERRMNPIDTKQQQMYSGR